MYLSPRRQAPLVNRIGTWATVPQPSIRLEPIIITVAVFSSVGLSFLCAKAAPGRRRFLIFAIVDLVALAVYEIYMYAIWEKTVHAPIRLDVFILDLPLLCLGLVLGIVGMIRFRKRIAN